MKRIMSIFLVVLILNSCVEIIHKVITGEDLEEKSKTLDEKNAEDLSVVNINEKINESMDDAKKNIKRKDKVSLKIDSVLRRVK